MSLEDRGVDLEHFYSVLDLSEVRCSTVLAGSEVCVKVNFEPVNKCFGLFVAHQIVDEELVFGTALGLKIIKLLGVTVNARLDEVNVLVGGG